MQDSDEEEVDEPLLLPSEDVDDEADHYIIDSASSGVAGGVSGRSLSKKVREYTTPGKTWVRDKTAPLSKPGDKAAADAAADADADADADEPEPAPIAPAAPVEFFDSIADIDGDLLEKAAMATTCFRRAAFDIDMDALEERPWMRPDADVSDYFNYGMHEEAWRGYVRRQKLVRLALQERKSNAQARTQARSSARPFGASSGGKGRPRTQRPMPFGSGQSGGQSGGGVFAQPAGMPPRGAPWMAPFGAAPGFTEPASFAQDPGVPCIESGRSLD